MDELPLLPKLAYQRPSTPQAVMAKPTKSESTLSSQTLDATQKIFQKYYNRSIPTRNDFFLRPQVIHRHRRPSVAMPLATSPTHNNKATPVEAPKDKASNTKEPLVELMDPLLEHHNDKQIFAQVFDRSEDPKGRRELRRTRSLRAIAWASEAAQAEPCDQLKADLPAQGCEDKPSVDLKAYTPAQECEDKPSVDGASKKPKGKKPKKRDSAQKSKKSEKNKDEESMAAYIARVNSYLPTPGLALEMEQKRREKEKKRREKESMSAYIERVNSYLPTPGLVAEMAKKKEEEMKRKKAKKLLNAHNERVKPDLPPPSRSVKPPLSAGERDWIKHMKIHEKIDRIGREGRAAMASQIATPPPAREHQRKASSGASGHTPKSKERSTHDSCGSARPKETLSVSKSPRTTNHTTTGSDGHKRTPSKTFGSSTHRSCSACSEHGNDDSSAEPSDAAGHLRKTLNSSFGHNDTTKRACVPLMSAQDLADWEN